MGLSTVISQGAVKPGRKHPPFTFCSPQYDRAYFPKFFGVTSFCLCQSGLLIDRRKSTLIGAPIRCPALGLTSCPVQSILRGELLTVESVLPSRVWGEGKAIIREVNKISKAEKAPGAAGSCGQEGSLRLGGQRCLHGTFSSCNLFPQDNLKCPSHSRERGSRGSKWFHVTGHGRVGV